MLIPIMPFDEVAIVAVKLPIKLLATVTGPDVVAALMRIPLTVVEAFVPLRSQILFLETVVPGVVPAAETTTPKIEAAPVDDKVLIVFPAMLIVGETLEQVMPVTLPPVPVDEKPVKVFAERLRVPVPLNVAPIEMPVIEL